MSFRTRMFLLTLGVVLSTLISAYAYLARQTRAEATERIRRELEVRLSMVDDRVAQSPDALDDLTRWDAIADALGKASRSRVTLIRLDGTVIGDSEVSLARLPSVENHGSRPEVLEALRSDQGVSSRRSSTVGQEMLYLARTWRRDGAVVGTLRISVGLTEVASATADLYRHLGLAGLLGLLVAFLGSSLMAHVATGNARELTRVAQKIAAGDLEARASVSARDEFATLALTLNGLAQNLSSTLGELRAERDRLTRVVTSMHEGVLLLDQEGRIQLVNSAAQNMLLLSNHAIGEKAESVLGGTELARRLQDALKGENSSVELQLDPSGRRVLSNVRRLHKLSGALAVLVDITERRRLETVRQEFVANASHELRTPITAIVSAVETLQDAAADDPEARATFIDIIDRNAQRLRSLVTDLLELSQLESGRFETECSPLDLKPLAEATLANFQAAARDKDIELLCLVPTQCTISGNARGLEHVLGNLVQNAINYCPPGSRVTVSTKQTPHGVELSVSDNGPGIAKEHLDRLFERFYRVDTGRSRAVGGTGLGLSIVRHWVEAMRGSVRVNSELGKGTSFFVTLASAP